jgi:GT2 family glycosyltransferase
MRLKSKLSVIIPTLNNSTGLEYLIKYFKNKQYEVVVVDNQKKNLGFAGGVNKGAENVKTKWMLILNDDIEFESSKIQVPRNKQGQNFNSQIRNEDTIQRLVNFAEKKKFDAISPILRNPNGEIENLGYKLLSIGKIQLIKEIPRNKSQETNMDGVTAACLLVRTEVFRKLGGFDEKFFAYLEDVDFFLRMKKMDSRLCGNDSKGRGNDRLPFGIAYDIEVLHNHMTTSKTMGNFKARQDMVNWWRLFFKHPDKFKLNLDFIIERMRNMSGYFKASFNS